MSARQACGLVITPRTPNPNPSPSANADPDPDPDPNPNLSADRAAGDRYHRRPIDRGGGACDALRRRRLPLPRCGRAAAEGKGAADRAAVHLAP
eukprot:scaffold32599_cov32-Phaeocystis_antarctica.AAC.2